MLEVFFGLVAVLAMVGLLMTSSIMLLELSIWFHLCFAFGQVWPTRITSVFYKCRSNAAAEQHGVVVGTPGEFLKMLRKGQ